MNTLAAAAVCFTFGSILRQGPAQIYVQHMQDIEQRRSKLEAMIVQARQQDLRFAQKYAECRAGLARCEAMLEALKAKQLEAEKRRKN